ncbi:MAG: ECF transporter S component [Firmicutes bacterium]|nr:ECF transporter S component [Bacillota bacterium]
MHLSVRQITLSGMLGAIAIVLAVTRIGFIPTPTGVAATIMHVPAILGAVLEGPVVGLLAGAVFGIFSFLQSPGFFADPLISIVPRLCIGLAAYYTFRWTRSTVAAAAAGTLTNTVGVLGLAVLRGYLPAKAAGVIALTHGLPELVLAVVLVGALARALSGRLGFSQLGWAAMNPVKAGHRAVQ